MTKQPTLTKADLIEEVLRVTELPRKESETIVETIFDSIIDALQKGDKIEIRGFGSFPHAPAARGRIGRNPKTGAKVEVPPKEENPILQAQQRAKRHRQHRRRRPRRLARRHELDPNLGEFVMTLGTFVPSPERSEGSQP